MKDLKKSLSPILSRFTQIEVERLTATDHHNTSIDVSEGGRATIRDLLVRETRGTPVAGHIGWAVSMMLGGRLELERALVIGSTSSASVSEPA